MNSEQHPGICRARCAFGAHYNVPCAESRYCQLSVPCCANLRRTGWGEYTRLISTRHAHVFPSLLLCQLTAGRGCYLTGGLGTVHLVMVLGEKRLRGGLTEQNNVWKVQHTTTLHPCRDVTLVAWEFKSANQWRRPRSSGQRHQRGRERGHRGTRGYHGELKGTWLPETRIKRRPTDCQLFIEGTPRKDNQDDDSQRRQGREGNTRKEAIMAHTRSSTAPKEWKREMADRVAQSAPDSIFPPQLSGHGG